MLICLREEYFKGHEVTWDEVEEHGLPSIPIEGDPPTSTSLKLKHSKSFSKLIENLRHAFAHNCFEVVGNPITGGNFQDRRLVFLTISLGFVTEHCCCKLSYRGCANQCGLFSGEIHPAWVSLLTLHLLCGQGDVYQQHGRWHKQKPYILRVLNRQRH